TRVLLGQHQSTGQLSIPPSDRTLNDGGTLTLTAAARAALGGRGPESVLTLIGPADYFAILAYVGPARDLYDELQGFRNDVRDRTGASTTCAYGPRYLHSSGQLHKGGPNSGVFVLLSATAGEDLPIPGEPFSFGTLELAQALGDFA